MKRDSDFSLTAKSVFGPRNRRKSVARRILRVRVSNDSARWAVSTVSRLEKFGFRVGSTWSARRATFSKFHTAVIVQWQFGCLRRDATIHGVGQRARKIF